MSVIENVVRFRTEEVKAKRVPQNIKLSESTARALHKEMKTRGWTKPQQVSPKGFWSFFSAKPVAFVRAIFPAENWKDLEGNMLYGMTIHICGEDEVYDL